MALALYCLALALKTSGLGLGLVLPGLGLGLDTVGLVNITGHNNPVKPHCFCLQQPERDGLLIL